jgi:alkanesulfonate monooxygenase SsuD/methylene tetrahydromethanopterin reductase-like flavin-dependent oxidoreductase (luciferase family)
MKFTYFHLMPFDGLPEDFTSRYRSVWVDIPSELFDARRMHTLYNDYLDELEYAAKCGFDAIGVNEHHNNAYGMMSSPNMMAATLARRTSDVKILVMGDAVPQYNPPIRIAEELAMLDVMSGGRLIAGFPLGSSQDTNFSYGQVPATTREQHREGFELVLRAWREREPFSFNGRFTKLRYVNPWPRPLQTPHPPVWIPGSGSLETMDFALENDFPYFFLSYFGADFARGMLQTFWERAELAGRDRNPNRVGMVQLVMVADTDEDAKRLYSEHVNYFFQRCTHIYPGFTEAPGYKSAESLKAVLPEPGSPVLSRPDSFAAAQKYTWEEMIEYGVVIGGSPETVIKRMEANARESNFANWVLMLHIGSMPRDLAMRNIELFTSEVMPKLGPIFSEYDNPWWPEPIEGLSTPASA